MTDLTALAQDLPILSAAGIYAVSAPRIGASADRLFEGLLARRGLYPSPWPAEGEGGGV